LEPADVDPAAAIRAVQRHVQFLTLEVLRFSGFKGSGLSLNPFFFCYRGVVPRDAKEFYTEEHAAEVRRRAMVPAATAERGGT
jgi:hypothetical protein